MYLFNFSFLFTALFFLSCGGNNENSTIQYHPIEERIPYQGDDVPVTFIAGETYELHEIESDSSLLKSSGFASNFSISAPSPITEFPLDESGLEIRSIDQSRILVLHTFTSRLYEYDISAKIWTEIAGEGRGPGELMFASDITVDGSTAYVSTRDYRISIFNCSETPCEFRETVPLEGLRPYSVAVTNSELTIMAPSSGMPNQQNLKDSLSILHNLNSQGEIISSFGEMYDVNGAWMLTQSMNNGKIKAIQNAQTPLLQYYKNLPNLYLFDTDQNLTKIISFKDFTLGKAKYNTKSQELSVPEEAWTNIDNVVALDNSRLIVSLVQISDPGVRDNRGMDFYLINLETSESIFLGSTHNKNEKIWFTGHHLLQMASQDWKIFNLES